MTTRDSSFTLPSAVCNALEPAAPAAAPRLPLLEHPTTLRLAATSVVALWVYFLVPRTTTDADIWWHLHDVSTQWRTHTFLHRDFYSFTAAGAPWINHEWLAELPLALGWHLGGSLGLYLVTLLTIESIFLGLLALAILRTGDSRLAMPVSVATTACAALLATVSFSSRTLLFGWACLVIELLIFEWFTTREDAILALPLLFTLWVNLHGSWLIGMVLLVTFAVGGSLPFRRGAILPGSWTPSRRRKLLLALSLSISALFLNPYGWRLVAYPFDLALHQPLNVASVEEWQPLDLQSARGVILLAAIAAIFVTQLLRRRSWTLVELAFAAIGVYAACRHARFLFLAGILVMPLLARSLAPSRPGSQPPPQDQLRTQASLLAAMLLLIVSLNVNHTRKPVAEAPLSGAALASVHSIPQQGRLFNEYAWGGYLGYMLPERAVFLDSRMDIFERNGTLRDYLDITRLKDSLALLDRYRIGYVLFEKESPLIYLLLQTHAWQTDYDDGRVILLERTLSRTAAQ